VDWTGWPIDAKGGGTQSHSCSWELDRPLERAKRLRVVCSWLSRCSSRAQRCERNGEPASNYVYPPSPRPSGRCPHRPLIFFCGSFLDVLKGPQRVELCYVRFLGAETHEAGSTVRRARRNSCRSGPIFYLGGRETRIAKEKATLVYRSRTSLTNHAENEKGGWCKPPLLELTPQTGYRVEVRFRPPREANIVC